jgi:hypothetical protein
MTEGRGLFESGIMFEVIYPNEARQGKARQEIRKGLTLMLAYYREILKENNCYLSRQISVLILVMSHSGTHT